MQYNWNKFPMRLELGKGLKIKILGFLELKHSVVKFDKQGNKVDKNLVSRLLRDCFANS